MYADLNVLRARAGRLAAAWGHDTDPDEDDLSRWLEECSAMLDLALGGAGVIDLPVDDSNAVTVLGGIAADGALVLAIEATWPGERAADAEAMLTGARARWEGALSSIAAGTSPVVVAIVSGSEEIRPPLSTSFWVEEPFYPYTGLAEDVCFPLSGPSAHRGQRY